MADPEIEAIYNPLPNHLHVPVTLQAAAAGKARVMREAHRHHARKREQLREAATKVHIMEAFMVRFHPQWLRARELVRSGKIGTLRAIQVFFSYFNNDPANIRNIPTFGGGALYDIGCYPIVAGRFFFEAEPQRVIALFDRDPALGTDRVVSALVDFGSGRHLDFTVSTQITPHQRVHLHGSKSRIEIQIPFNPAQGARPGCLSTTVRLWTDRSWRPRPCLKATSTCCKARRSRAPCAARLPSPTASPTQSRT